VESANAPLFILAPPRSFTSVICAMIGQHPELLGLPEVNLFAADDFDSLERSLYRMRPGFRHGLLRAIAEVGLGEQTVQNIEAAMAWLEDNRELPTSDLFRDLASWAAPRRLVDKSPIYVYTDASLERIRTAFPDASYLHLTRHPVTMCRSVFQLRERVQGALGRRRAGGAGGQRPAPSNRFADVEDPESMWLVPHRRILDFLDRVPAGQWHRVRGEAFMEQPDEHLATIAEWLGIDAGPEALEAMKHPEHSPFAAYGPPNARFGNDPSFLESPALRPYKAKDVSLDDAVDEAGEARLSDSVKELAREFGYR
jgi:hypothetical protein